MKFQVFVANEEDRLQVYHFLHRLGYSYCGYRDVVTWEKLFGEYIYLTIDDDYEFYSSQANTRLAFNGWRRFSAGNGALLPMSEFFVAAEAHKVRVGG